MSKDIHTAAKEGDLAAIEAALARGESVNAKDGVSQIKHLFYTPLFFPPPVHFMSLFTLKSPDFYFDINFIIMFLLLRYQLSITYTNFTLFHSCFVTSVLFCYSMNPPVSIELFYPAGKLPCPLPTRLRGLSLTAI
jgi:hypothetical protein